MDEDATHDQMQRREKKDQRPAEANESEIQIGGMFFGRSIHILDAALDILARGRAGGTLALESALGTVNLRERPLALRAGRLPTHQTAACLEPDPEGSHGDEQGNEEALLEPPVEGEEPIVDARHLELHHVGRSEVSRGLLHLHHRVEGHATDDEIPRHDPQHRPGDQAATLEPAQAIASGMIGVLMRGVGHLVIPAGFLGMKSIALSRGKVRLGA
ncbi:MAG: hypothetical protein GY895_08445 [Phycisphaera sp.]|nr:hypothetical protein [Phycisphaera sp.]